MVIQESARRIEELGMAFGYSCVIAGLVVYMPLFAAGFLGHWLRHASSRVVLAAALDRGLEASGRHGSYNIPDAGLCLTCHSFPE